VHASNTHTTDLNAPHSHVTRLTPIPATASPCHVRSLVDGVEGHKLKAVYTWKAIALRHTRHLHTIETAHLTWLLLL